MKVRASIAAIVVCAGAIAASQTVFGTDLRERYTGMFRALDTDNNASLTREEALASGLSQTSFKRLDRDGDKSVSLTEFLVLAEDTKLTVAARAGGEAPANPCRRAAKE